MFKTGNFHTIEAIKIHTEKGAPVIISDYNDILVGCGTAKGEQLVPGEQVVVAINISVALMRFGDATVVLWPNGKVTEWCGQIKSPQGNPCGL